MIDGTDIDDPDGLRLGDPRWQGVAVMPVVLAGGRVIMMGSCQVEGEAAGGQHNDYAHASEPRNR